VSVKIKLKLLEKWPPEFIFAGPAGSRVVESLVFYWELI
jgi:hypothetical protein